MWQVIEKNNPLAVHAICMSEKSAREWISEKASVYCAKKYFVNKTLTPDSFTVVKKD